MNIAIVGSRNIAEMVEGEMVARIVITNAIRRWMVLAPEGVTIVSGGARGVDSIAEQVARDLSLPTIIHLPNWERDGRGAGFKRNRLIVRDADVLIAIFADGPKSKGTSDSVAAAKIKGIPTYIYHEGVWS